MIRVHFILNQAAKHEDFEADVVITRDGMLLLIDSHAHERKGQDITRMTSYRPDLIRNMAQEFEVAAFERERVVYWERIEKAKAAI
jgi:hypothetical protein